MSTLPLIPADATAARRLTDLFHDGQLAEICRWAEISPERVNSLPTETQQLVAIAFAQLRRFESAEPILRKLVAGDPDRAIYRENLGVLMLNAGKPAEALPLLEAALRDDPRSRNTRFNLGLVYFALGHFERASTFLAQTCGEEPDNDVARLYLARANEEMGRFWVVNEIIRGWNPRTSFSKDELYEFGRLLLAADHLDHAVKAYSLILNNHPDEALARINLAVLHERCNRVEEAQVSLDSVPGTQRNSALYWLTYAKLQQRRGQHANALQSLERAAQLDTTDPEAPAAERLQVEISFERGQILDRQGHFEEAYAAFRQGNDRSKALYRRFNPATGSGERIEWLKDQPELDGVVRRARDFVPAERSPVFLVGFPRSGTTLMDRMLDAHPALSVLEEKPALEAAERLIARSGGLNALSDKSLLEARAKYWEVARTHVDIPADVRLVDKFPFNLGRLHLGMSLFPMAKWIFAVRHPLDVVLSCFMQNFRFTDATHGFWTVEQTASIYEQVMGLWLAQRQRLSPLCLDSRYETMVEDPEGEARRIIAFLELPWDPEMMEFHRRARNQHITTPSYRQVAEPVYARARGRWKNYRRWIEPAIERLVPLILALGYPDPRQTGPTPH